MSIFNRDFYPTPAPVIDMMLEGLDLRGKVILEPSAGKGDIVRALKERGASQVLTYEKSEDLAKILKGESTFMGYDFLDSGRQELSHVDYIIMNPPFSADEKHINHAWKVAPDGCRIIALCNSESIRNAYSMGRRLFVNIIKDHGTDEELGDVFSDAERKTDVQVSMIKLFKPIASSGFDYEGFFLDVDEAEYARDGIMRYSEIRSIVSRYVSALRVFDEFEGMAERMDEYVRPLGLSGGFSFRFGYRDNVTTKAEFGAKLQEKSWKLIFARMGMEKFVTTKVMEDLNVFIQKQSKYPFTMRNVYVMLSKLISDRYRIMNDALIDAFDSITRHYHDNRYNVEGWKTNSHYLIGRRFILPYVVEVDYFGGFSFRRTGNLNKIMDLSKALAYITAQPDPLADFWTDQSRQNTEFGEAFDLGFFEAKGYKKGTLHCKFKDEQVWWEFNRKVAEIKGFPLPEKV